MPLGEMPGAGIGRIIGFSKSSISRWRRLGLIPLDCTVQRGPRILYRVGPFLRWWRGADPERATAGAGASIPEETS